MEIRYGFFGAGMSLPAGADIVIPSVTAGFGFVQLRQPLVHYDFVTYRSSASTGVRGVVTDWIEIARSDVEDERSVYGFPFGMGGRSARFFVYDSVAGRAQSDIEVWVYGPRGRRFVLVPRRRVWCTGIVGRSIEADVTLGQIGWQEAVPPLSEGVA